MRYPSLQRLFGVALCATGVWALGQAAAGPAITPVPVLPAINQTHFHCYAALGNPVQKQVKLRDQFQTAAPVFTGRPAYLCAPVQKNGEETPDMTTHLTCYQIEGAHPANRTVRVDNQFGSQILRVNNSQLLCVPSRKTVLLTGQPQPLTPQQPCLSAPPAVPGVRYGTRNLALGADVAAGTASEILLLINSYQTTAAQFQFGVGGPSSDVLEVCISLPQPAPASLGPAVGWTVEDPLDPARKSDWATKIFSPIAVPLANVSSTNVGGHGVIKIDFPASQFKQAILGDQPYFGRYPGGRSMITLTVGGRTFQMHVTVGQE